MRAFQERRCRRASARRSRELRIRSTRGGCVWAEGRNRDPVAAKGIDVGVAERGESPVFVVTLSGSAGMDSNNECTSDGRADEVGWPAVTVLAAPTGVLELELPPASLTVVVCELPDPAFELAGQVATPSGEPLSGATIEADSGSATYTATADRLGLFRLNDIPRGTFTVSVDYRDGWVTSPQQVDLEQEPFPIANFTLTPRLSGTVRLPAQQGGGPVPGAAVWVEPSGGGAVIASTTTDCEGNFTLPVAGGTFDVKADFPDDGITARVKANVNVTASATCINFVLAAGATPTLCN